VLRIVGVHRHENPDNEFILLQNQGAMRIALRGHVLLSEVAIERGVLAGGSYVFSETELIPPGIFVILRTGWGITRWARTRDGSPAFQMYACMHTPLWHRCEGAISILNTQHTYVERREPALQF
jgi:hypothetical protein